MDLIPIREIRAVRSVGAVRKIGSEVESEVQPAFAFAPAARLDDDEYRGGKRDGGRGMDDEEPEEFAVSEEKTEQAELSDDLDSQSVVNFLA